MPSPTWTSMLLRAIPILLAFCHLTIADEGVTQIIPAPSRFHQYRRLFGIRRLKPITPLAPPSSEHRANPVRRQQARNYEIIELPDYVPRAQVPPVFGDRRVAIPHTIDPIVKKPVLRGNSADEDELKRKKIEARWRRLGINPKTIYYPTRKPKLYDSEEDDEEIETVTRIPDILKATRDRLRSHRIQQLNIEERDRIVRPTHPYSTNKDLISVPSTPNTRKSVPSVYEDKDTKPRPRIQGPILSAPGDLGAPVQTPAIPRVFSPISQQSGDYHSRTIPIRKNYQFTEKLSQRPRLRIRRPGEPRAEEPYHSNEDPTLTPFENNARTKAGFGGAAFAAAAAAAGAFANLPQQPAPVTQAPVPPSPPPTPPPTTPAPTTAPPPPPTTTAAPTTTPPPPPPPPPSPPSTEQSGAESGAGFGIGPSELPPEFANIGFGIGGADGNALSFGPEESSRPKQRKQPNPELAQENLVIPQNSGLRPVAPPKEFGGGGFGSGSGGFGGGGFGGGGFGGGGGGFGGGGGGFGGGAGGAPSRPAPPAAPEEPSEADFFTGDSALVPSKGPTGDGYGPPVFPGGAAPPPVASVGVGGAAAGKSPYGAQMMEVTENPPTTVKPSAMLDILNRADQGFNQAIRHFESGTPVESAALDILEVALGSEKLDSQAKLLGHVDRTIGLDNLQRIQRWANTAGAMDFFKEQFVKLAKNFEPAEDLLPTVPPQFEYLFKRGR